MQLLRRPGENRVAHRCEYGTVRVRAIELDELALVRLHRGRIRLVQTLANNYREAPGIDCQLVWVSYVACMSAWPVAEEQGKSRGLTLKFCGPTENLAYQNPFMKPLRRQQPTP